jgi:hypothetical protein
MGIRKAGSRPIVVDGERYHWRIQRHPTDEQSSFTVELVVVEHEEAQGSPLVLLLPGSLPASRSAGGGVVVTPALVARSIGRALADGWNPRVPGKPFELRVEAPPGSTTPDSGQPPGFYGFQV